MIVSHRHDFIFIKTSKTGGTSVEIGLSMICGPDDVITPFPPELEAMRPGHEGKNYEIPRERMDLRDRLVALLTRSPRIYSKQIGARRIRAYVGDEVWNRSKKIAIVRNPWDREASRYFYKRKKKSLPPTFEGFVKKMTARRPMDNFEAHSLDGMNIADRVLRYESLHEDYAALLREFGVEDPPPLPRLKGQYRPAEARDYRQLYNSETRDIVANAYGPEIAAFGYRF
jgi:hypothetical protein